MWLLFVVVELEIQGALRGMREGRKRNVAVVDIVNGSGDGSLGYDSNNHCNPAYGNSLGRGNWRFKVPWGDKGGEEGARGCCGCC